MSEKPTLNIVLVEPRIPQNTGNVARTCACTACRLHLVGPMGFAIDDKKLKHAGLDYWHYLDISYYDGLDDFFAKNNGPYYYFTTKAPQRYTDVAYPDGAYLVFGREDAGLPEALLAANQEHCIRMPMRDTCRSLNLSNSVAVACTRCCASGIFRSFWTTDIYETTNGNEVTMSKIAILTDSSCDIPQEMAEKYGIDIMSFHILLDDVDYVERESCTNTEFYDKMRLAKGVPSTAAITPIQFCEKYCQYVDEGYTDVIHVPINKSGSSTYNNALMAQGMLREERPEHHMKIHLLDPHTYSMVFGWYLCEMARKLKNGAEISHVIQEFEKQMNCMEIILGPYSLKQMKKSGRISAAAAVMGELMGVRPIITLIDGKTKVESKVRGDDKVVPAMIELCKKRADGVENFDYMIGHTNIKQAEDLEKACRKAFGKAPLVVFELGGVVSANTGPDTVALVYTGHPRG